MMRADVLFRRLWYESCGSFDRAGEECRRLCFAFLELTEELCAELFDLRSRGLEVKSGRFYKEGCEVLVLGASESTI